MRFCEECGGDRQPDCPHDWVPASGAVKAVQPQTGEGGVQFITTGGEEEHEHDDRVGP